MLALLYKTRDGYHKMNALTQYKVTIRVRSSNSSSTFFVLHTRKKYKVDFCFFGLFSLFKCINYSACEIQFFL